MNNQRSLEKDHCISAKRCQMDSIYQRYPSKEHCPIDGELISTIVAHLVILDKVSLGKVFDEIDSLFQSPSLVRFFRKSVN